MKAQNKIKTFISNNTADTEKFAFDLAKTVKNKDIFCLEGDLGVGKTVIAKSIGKFFNVKDDMISPTFNIVKVYNVDNNNIKRINHFDLYRLKNESELMDIGFEDYIYDDGAITLIEWPAIAKEILPKKAKWINIEKTIDNNNTRKISYDI